MAIARFLRSDQPAAAGARRRRRLSRRALDWKSEPALERLSGPAQGTDEVGLSHATAAVAETGTLVMASGADNPVTLNFLPETHIVVVEDEDSGRRLRGSVGEDPRALRPARHAAHGQLRLGARRAPPTSAASW